MTVPDPTLGAHALSPRQQAHALYREMFKAASPQELPGVQRWLAQNDLFFLVVHVLNRVDADRDWLFARCREVSANPNGRIDIWAREHYKMQRLDEPTPTPDGWKLHGELKVGDCVFGADGQPCRVIALNKIVEDAECFEIEFDDGVKIQSGAEHLWPIDRRTRKRIPGTSKIGAGKSVYRETVLMSTRDIANHHHRADQRLAIRVTEPIFLPVAALPIDPYVLGAWLGDGTSSNGNITCGDAALFDEIASRGYALGPNTTPARNSQYRKIVGLSKSLRSLDLIGNKHIPAPYLRASIGQRLDLLRGLMDTDGHCNTRGTATFVNINERLVDGVYELAASLGLRPMKRRHVGKHNGEPYPFWQVSFQAYEDTCPFLLKRKAARCKAGKRKNARHFIVACRPVPSVPMRCIQVEGGIYLTGRAMVPTHNSSIITFALTLQDILKNPEITVGIFSRSRPQAKAFMRQIKVECENNQVLKDLFPEVLWRDPMKEAPTWSLDDGLIFRRKGNPKEATIEAWGLVDGQPVGKHFKLVVYDDIIDQSAVTSDSMIETVTSAWELSLSLGTDGGHRRYVGTFYSHADTYTKIIERGAAKPRIHPATDNGEDDGKSVLLSEETLRERRLSTSAYNFSCFDGATKILMGDFTERAIADIRVGDVVIGFTFERDRRTRLARAVVQATHHRRAPAVCFKFESGRELICTRDHKFYTGHRDHAHNGRDNTKATYRPLGLRYHDRRAAISVYDPRRIYRGAGTYEAAYLGGIFDGEGAVSDGTIHIVQSRNKNPAVCARIEETLTALGFDYGLNENICGVGKERSLLANYYIRGGREEKIRFLNIAKPARGEKIALGIIARGARDIGNHHEDKLISIDDVGEIDVFNIQTETGNYIAGGYAVKNCQYLCSPTKGVSRRFMPEWLRNWNKESIQGMNVYILVDAANAKKKRSDYTSMWVVGLGRDRNYYVIDGVRDRLDLGQRAAMLFKLVGDYAPIKVAYEEYGLMADIAHIKSLQDQYNFHFEIQPLGGNVGKTDRIEWLIPIAKQARLYLPHRLMYTTAEGERVDIVAQFVNQEYLQWPVPSHDDMLDCLSRIVDPKFKTEWPALGGKSTEHRGAGETAEVEYDVLRR